MAHWRDGGIGNMPGSDDRPIEEWTLLEKLAEIASTLKGWQLPKCLGVAGPNTDWGTPLSKIASEAFDEIQRLREGWGAAGFPTWQPIDTAPVEPGHTAPSYYRFRCLLQNARGEVFEGAAYYVKLGRATTHLTLRWQNASQRQVFPKYWMPLPAPKPAEKAQNCGAA